MSGCIGTKFDSDELVEGGLGAETTQVLRNIETILAGLGVGLDALTKVNVFLHANSAERFAEMNAAYIDYFGYRPAPPRITVGCVGLALGANVEMDASAVLPPAS